MSSLLSCSSLMNFSIFLWKLRLYLHLYKRVQHFALKGLILGLTDALPLGATPLRDSRWTLRRIFRFLAERSYFRFIRIIRMNFLLLGRIFQSADLDRPLSPFSHNFNSISDSLCNRMSSDLHINREDCKPLPGILPLQEKQNGQIYYFRPLQRCQIYI